MTLGTSARRYRRSGIADLVPDAAVRPAGGYPRIPGTLIGGSPRIRNAFEQLQAATPVDLGDVASGVLHNVTVVGGGLTLTDDGHIVSETLNCIQNLREYRGLTQSPDGNVWTEDEPIAAPEYVPSVPGRQHVLLKSAWDANYGHWLFDTLARLSLLRDMELPGRPLLVVNERSGLMANVMMDSLELAGYGPDDVVHHSFDPRRYESLLVLGSLTRHPEEKSRLAAEHLDQLATSTEPGQTRRVYLTRNNYSRRRLLNEDLLWPLFEKRGFTRVPPESLRLREQIALFKGVELVAGNLGASFSNLAFAPPGVGVLALTTPTMEHDFFYDIACLKDGRYVAVQGISAEDEPTLGSDFYAEGFAVSEALDLLDAASA